MNFEKEKELLGGNPV